MIQRDAMIRSCQVELIVECLLNHLKTRAMELPTSVRAGRRGWIVRCPYDIAVDVYDSLARERLGFQPVKHLRCVLFAVFRLFELDFLGQTADEGQPGDIVV